MMWQRAIAPREPNAPTFISTFAGGGGSSTGYLMAGFHELLAVEWDDNAVETLRLNHPNLNIYHGDIAQLSVEECLERVGLQAGELDMLDGSPPCQGFSIAGKREMSDERNQLFREFTRLLQGLRPKTFVMENVGGLVKGKMKLIFAEILTELKACGYRVSCRLLSAKFFHVPQKRERLIFIGVRDDLGIEPSHPRAESRPITVRQAIKEFEDLPADRSMKDWMQEACKLIKSSHGSKEIGLIFVQFKGTTGSAISTTRLDYNKPSNTISKQEIAVSGLIHPTKHRYLIQQELARLGSFPDAYQFTDRRSACARIGNSVPPLMAEAIGRHIRTELLARIT